MSISALTRAIGLVVTVVLGCTGVARAQCHWVRCKLPSVPAARVGHAMAHDTRRGRVVLFGGLETSGLVGDTWEWDGVRWTKLSPVTSPGPRSRHAMAYDAARGRVVLFGGNAKQSNGGDTWEWDGKTWTRFWSTYTPRPRQDHVMAYDPVRGRVVLFGGYGTTSPHGPRSDLWEWDGKQWTQRTPTSSPPARFQHSMAFDASRGRLVVFGGLTSQGTQGTLADTWEWDGKAWAQRKPKTSPPDRCEHAMAYDPVRKRVVLVAGQESYYLAKDDTWEWDGTSWTKQAPAGHPPPVSGHAMVWDSTRRRIVLFGGKDGLLNLDPNTWEYDGSGWRVHAPPRPDRSSSPTLTYHASRGRVVLFGGSYQVPSGDVWEWDGAAWTRLATPLHPSPRGGHAVAYDSRRQCSVLFGGNAIPRQYYVAYDDTWEWDGVSWTRRSPATRPSVRFGHAMAYDAARGRVVLFGGAFHGVFMSSPVAVDGTWEWDGVDWREHAPGVNEPIPEPRHGHAMAYDARRKRVVMFGGFGDNLGPLGDTWEWDGVRWAPCSPTRSPGPRSNHSMCYDPVRGRVILHGGAWYSTRMEDTWEWDGTEWHLRAPGMSPQRTPVHGLAFDVVRQRAVLLGKPDPQVLQSGGSETWEYSDTTLAASGAPRLGRTVRLLLTVIGDSGRSYQLGSSLGAGPFPLAGRTIGLSVDGLLLVSTSGAWPTVFKGYRGVIAANGHAGASIVIPVAPALVGVRIYSAYVTLDPAGPDGVRSISNTASFTVLP